jgi:hypothetical protein
MDATSFGLIVLIPSLISVLVGTVAWKCRHPLSDRIDKCFVSPTDRVSTRNPNFMSDVIPQCYLAAALIPFWVLWSDYVTVLRGHDNFIPLDDAQTLIYLGLL